MKDEELAEEYLTRTVCQGCRNICEGDCAYAKPVRQAFLAGLKAGRPQWHKVKDWKDNSQFPNEELKTYLVRLYQDHYVICEIDITEGYRQFYLSDNLEFIDPQEVIAWCEIPTFDKE